MLILILSLMMNSNYSPRNKDLANESPYHVFRDKPNRVLHKICDFITAAPLLGSRHYGLGGCLLLLIPGRT